MRVFDGTLPEGIRETMPRLYETDGKVKGPDKIMMLRFVTPMREGDDWVHYYCELGYEEYPNDLYGYVFGYEGEWGYTSLDELVNGVTMIDDEFKPTRFADVPEHNTHSAIRF